MLWGDLDAVIGAWIGSVGTGVRKAGLEKAGLWGGGVLWEETGLSATPALSRPAALCML